MQKCKFFPLIFRNVKKRESFLGGDGRSRFSFPYKKMRNQWRILVGAATINNFFSHLLLLFIWGKEEEEGGGVIWKGGSWMPL